MVDPAAPTGRTSPAATATRLPGGLELRTARPADLDQIGTLLVERGDEADGLDHRLVVHDPDLGWDASAVVVDGDRVAATATLLDETVRLGDVTLPAGQVELVAVHPDYEHRGLARALMGWAHRRSADRGHLVQLIIGIPYFYRRFGYEYAIDIPPARRLVGSVPEVGAAAGALRDARSEDLPGLVGLQEATQAAFDVAVPHPAARWRALLAQSASRTRVLERDGAVVASARVRADDDGLVAAEPAAVDAGAANALLARLAAQLPDGQELSVVHRAGTVTGDTWDRLLDVPDAGCEQYYLRIPDVGALLGALRPVLWRRACALAPQVLGEALVISTFGAHHRLPVTADGFGPVQTGGPMQSPGVHGGFGVAPDQLGALLFGQRGFAGLRRVRPDVYGRPAVGEALFPAVTADLLTYYLPW
ncbi:GNAT family N-acetyltransferase [Isoptericola sp. b441]|uniref:GNAT family N-acetyltransferase n=1 Tax=Actinotalea lenta TaxID=3064654 RepID=A0ABT9D5Y6_9CELL|nr:MULTISPECIES: GNAT family N-acetyltransferase [unclassified Isoptericola]MDO8106220.1 GNAT family N-acetyltransferase [Isoptericola sp. b441]MDO8122060.1 GNAT family N-acetyltransferase [Isoptericola sp. b490]